MFKNGVTVPRFQRGGAHHASLWQIAMSPEPKTVKEAAFAVASVEARLDLAQNLAQKSVEAQLGLVQKMVWAVIALLGTLFGGAIGLYVQIGDLKTDIAVIKTNVAAINAHIIDVSSPGDRASKALERIEARLDTGGGVSPLNNQGLTFQVGANGSPVLTLSSDETQLIRDILKPVPKGTPQQFRVGDSLGPGIFISLLPTPITSKFPRLRGLFYFFDPVVRSWSLPSALSSGLSPLPLGKSAFQFAARDDEIPDRRYE
jgi:hypothetical protein